MANTYTQIHIQAVFAVQGRRSLIDPDWKDELYKYISGIFRNQKQKLLAIGGVEDHIHLLFGIRPNVAISDLLRDVKANSSAFVNESGLSAVDSAGKKDTAHFLTQSHRSTSSRNTC